MPGTKKSAKKSATGAAAKGQRTPQPKKGRPQKQGAAAAAVAEPKRRRGAAEPRDDPDNVQFLVDDQLHGFADRVRARDFVTLPATLALETEAVPMAALAELIRTGERALVREAFNHLVTELKLDALAPDDSTALAHVLYVRRRLFPTDWPGRNAALNRVLVVLNLVCDAHIANKQAGARRAVVRGKVAGGGPPDGDDGDGDGGDDGGSEVDVDDEDKAVVKGAKGAKAPAKVKGGDRCECVCQTRRWPGDGCAD